MPKVKKHQVPPRLPARAAPGRPACQPAGLATFDYQPRTRLVFGVGRVEQTGTLARELGAQHVLLVTDPGIVAAGHVARVQRILKSAGLRVTVFDESRENPTTRCVDKCMAVAKRAGIDTIVGLGGGSSLDTAKGCNFLLTNGGRMQDYRGNGKATRPMLPLIAIPTTAGTGSECQSFTLIADEKTHQKMACGDPKAAPRVAILDPKLTLTQPPRVTACAGLDAIAHAVETAVTTKRNRVSQMFSREAFKQCVTALAKIFANPDDLEARGQMQLGAAFAGMAVETSMLGAAHAAANPLTAHCGIIHGQAVGMMLPLVVRFNGADAASRRAYAELMTAAGFNNAGRDSEAALAGLIQRLEALLNLAGMPRSLADCGVERSQISVLADEAARQWTAAFNPRAITAADFKRLYEAAFRQRGHGGPANAPELP